MNPMMNKETFRVFVPILFLIGVKFFANTIGDWLLTIIIPNQNIRDGIVFFSVMGLVLLLFTIRLVVLIGAILELRR